MARKRPPAAYPPPLRQREDFDPSSWLYQHWEETSPAGIYTEADRQAAREALGEDRIRRFCASLMEGLGDHAEKTDVA